MKHPKLRIAWSVTWAIVAVLLIASVGAELLEIRLKMAPIGDFYCIRNHVCDNVSKVLHCRTAARLSISVTRES